MAERIPSDAVREQRTAILDAARRHRADNVRIFGSVATGSDTAHSDIDLIVTFEPFATLFDLVELEDELESITGFSVDVISDKAVRVPVVAQHARPL